MTYRVPTAIVLILGVGIAGIGLLHPNPPNGSVLWLGVASVYLTTVVLLGGARFFREDLPTTFIHASLVAFIAVLIAIAIRIWSLLSARPEVGITEVWFVLWQISVLVPFVIGGMSPLGIANSRSRRILVAGVIGITFLVAIVRGILRGSGFGPRYVVLYNGYVLVVGLVAGLPLYVYGRQLRG